jgi:hypothetical protein
MQSIFETFPDRLNSETEFVRAMRHHMSVLPTFRKCALRTMIQIVPTDGTKAANLVSGDFGRPPFWAALR